ncbi:MAG: hypothetical protein JOY61_15780, partial [Chloroflexi bacterium]|nr:hypothetical protein [Chloroflexota bacterium]
MSHAADAARLVSQFSALCQRCAILGDHLADASRELAAGGALPGVALIDELDVARSEFADIRRQALDLAAALNACSPSGAHEAATLEALETLLRSVAEATERQATSEARRRALAVLERVMSLRHREDAEFGPLAACHASAAELTAVISGVEWPATHPELTALADGSHPFSQLADFVEHQSELDDAGWELLHEAVAASLGRPLAVAAARGKLLFAQQSSTVQDDEDDWPTVSIATLPPEQPVGSLVWRALLADRPAVAFLSATLADGAAERVDAPVWLLRSLVLSRHVHYPNGDIALQLAEDFSSCEPTELGAGSEEQEVPQALRLLVAAAALRPALVAPETGAWAILRALPEAPALRSTQAYLRQVAEYGERNAAIASHTLAPLLSSTVWRDRMEDLRREVGAWRVRFLGMRSSYPPATAVWRRWLLPDGLIHALLDPVTLEVRGLETARGLVERLSNDAQIRWEIDDTDRRLLGRAHGPDIAIRPDALEQLAERVREAVGFVRRWIALEECRPNRPDDEPRKAGLRLQQQLAELRPAVIDELAAAQAEARSLPLQAALAECRAALSDVDALLDDSSSLALREPPLAALLYADLLHVAGSCLDENWLPCRGSRASRDRLEQLLGMDHRSAWRATFERRRLEKDHLATLEVIQCLEMQREGARELQAARAEDLQRCRNALRHDVEQTRELVDVAAAEGRLDDDTRARLLAVVEQIGMIVPDVLRFEPR